MDADSILRCMKHLHTLKEEKEVMQSNIAIVIFHNMRLIRILN